MKTLLIVAYMMGAQAIDTDVIENATMEECQATKSMALDGPNPITTKHGPQVHILAECHKDEATASLTTQQQKM